MSDFEREHLNLEEQSDRRPPQRPRDGLDYEHQDPRDYRDDPPPRPAPRPAPKPQDKVVHHPDGTVETTHPDGSMDITFRNGNTESRLVDGTVIRGDLRHGTTETTQRDGTHDTEFPDGRIVSELSTGLVMTVYANGNSDSRYPDGTVQHFRARTDGGEPQLVAVEKPDGSWEAHRADGAVVTTNLDGSVVIRNPDGSSTQTSLDQPTETRDADGTVTLLWPNNNQEIRKPDGTVSRYDERDGSFQTDRPDGTSEIAFGSDDRTVSIDPDGTRISYPNGTKVISHRDGIVERTNTNGDVIEVEHADGRWDFHRLDGQVQHNFNDGTIVFDRTDGTQQIFHPDNSEEIRDLRAGDEPFQPPDGGQVPILGGTAPDASSDEPAIGDSDGLVDVVSAPLSDFVERAPDEPGALVDVMSADADVLIEAAEPAGVSAESVSFVEEPVGFGAEPVTGVSATQFEGVEEPVGFQEEPVVGFQEEPVTGVSEQDPSSLPFDPEATTEGLAAFTEAAFDSIPKQNLLPPLGEESIEGWDTALGNPSEQIEEAIEQAVENEDGDWTQ